MYRIEIFTDLNDLTNESKKFSFDIESNLVYTSTTTANFDEITFETYLPYKANFQPYCIAKITNGDVEIRNKNGDIEWCCSSEVLTYNGKNLHKFRLLDVSCLLSNYILGTKSFSNSGTNKTDYEKVDIICKVINQRYQEDNLLTIAPQNEFFNSSVNKEIEYQFRSGTTAYEALVAIAKNYSAAPTAKIKYNTNGTFAGLIVYFKSQSGNQASIYSIGEANVESVNVSQSIDEYCNGLETEAKNVLADNSNWVRNLSYRSDDAYFDSEGGKLILPSKIARIDQFLINIDNFFAQNTIVFEVPSYVLIDSYLEDNLGVLQPITEVHDLVGKTVTEWRTYFKTNFKDAMATLLTDLLSHMNKPLNIAQIRNLKFSYNMSWKDPVSYNGKEYAIFQLFLHTPFSGSIDITDKILEKRQYDLKLINEKPKFVYWEYDKNYIDGFFVSYRNDNIMDLFNRVPPFESHIFGFYNYKIFLSDDVNFSVYSNAGITNATNEKISYDIKYVPISNMLIRERKNSTFLNYQTNQDAFKANQKIFRSYNQKADIVDFNRLISNLKTSADIIGNENITYTLRNVEFNRLPSIRQKVILFSKTYYINALEAVYFPNGDNPNLKVKSSITLNLTRNQSDLFQSEALETQYHSTANPLENIVDRYIYVEFEKDDLYTFNTDDELYLVLSTLRNAKASISHTNYPDGFRASSDVIVRLNIFNDDNSTYFVGACEDFYSVGSYVKGIESYKVVYPVNYVDDHNELTLLKLGIIKLNNTLSSLEADNLPYISLSNQMDFDYVTKGERNYNKTVYVYKDARERLIFVIKLK